MEGDGRTRTNMSRYSLLSNHQSVTHIISSYFDWHELCLCSYRDWQSYRTSLAKMSEWFRDMEAEVTGYHITTSPLQVLRELHEQTKVRSKTQSLVLTSANFAACVFLNNLRPKYSESEEYFRQIVKLLWP